MLELDEALVVAKDIFSNISSSNRGWKNPLERTRMLFYPYALSRIKGKTIPIVTNFFRVF
jgi:hypothetical protein